MIIDCHVHADNSRKVQSLLKSMKANAIDISIILYFPLWKKQGYLSLEKLIPVVAGHPELHLAGSIRLKDNPDYDRHLEVLRRAAQHREIVAVKLYPGYEPFFPSDSIGEPIYQLCTENDIPVIFHSGDTWWLFPTSKVRYANPVYIDDVAASHPDLKILIAHLGNPWIRETAEVVSKNRNVYTDLSGLLCPPHHPQRFAIRYTQKLREEILDLVAYYGNTDKLLFGTDFPLYDQKTYLEFFDSIRDFTHADRERILYKNALNFFALHQ